MKNAMCAAGTEDKLDVVLKIIWPVIAAFLMGRLEICGEPVAAVFYITAVCVRRLYILPTYLALVAGVYSVGDYQTVIVYSLIMLGIAIVSSIRNVSWLRCSVMVSGLVSMLWYVVVCVGTDIFRGQAISYVELGIIGAIIFSGTVIFEKALRTLREDILSVAVEPQATMAMAVYIFALLYAIPPYIGPVACLTPIAILSLMYVSFRFGMGLGLSWGVLCGLIMTIRFGSTEYIIAYTIIMLISMGIYNLARPGKLLYALIFAVVWVITGMLGYRWLLDFEGVKAFASAVLIFVCIPTRLVSPVDVNLIRSKDMDNSPEWGQLVMRRVKNFSDSLKRVEYTMADATVGLSFGEMGNIIDSFTASVEQKVPLRKTVETDIRMDLRSLGVEARSLMLMKSREGYYEIYLVIRCMTGKLVHINRIKDILETDMKVSLTMDENCRNIVGKNYEAYAFKESPAYTCQTAARVMSRYEDVVSGDNYYIGDIGEGQKLLMISDGMGSGEKASMSSQNLIDSMEELLGAGVDRNLAIRLVNSYLAEKNKGEIFATMDMLILDTATAVGRLFKQGAATTYIRRRDWMEQIKSTSLPAGVTADACCESCAKKFYDQDVIVMISDGVLEDLVYENKEDYMKKLIMDMDYNTAEEIADHIASGIKKNSYKSIPDDATVVVCKIVKNRIL